MRYKTTVFSDLSAFTSLKTHRGRESKNATLASGPHCGDWAKGLIITDDKPPRKQVTDKLKHIIGDCEMKSMSRRGLDSPSVLSRCCTAEAKSRSTTDGRTTVCWAPMTMAVSARMIPMYQSAGPDQWTPERVTQEREAILAAKITRLWAPQPFFSILSHARFDGKWLMLEKNFKERLTPVTTYCASFDLIVSHLFTSSCAVSLSRLEIIAWIGSRVFS